MVLIDERQYFRADNTLCYRGVRVIIKNVFLIARRKTPRETAFSLARVYY